MMNFEEITNKLELYARTVHNAVSKAGWAEILLTIVIGILSNQLTTPIHWAFLVTISLIYLILVVLRINYTTNFPLSFVNEFKSERMLNELKADLTRQRKITDIYVRVMKNLNSQTCKLEEDEQRLCDTGIKDSIAELLTPLTRELHILLDTFKEEKFTLGIYLQGYRTLDSNNLDQGVILIKDELDKQNLLSKELMSLLESIEGEQLKIQSIIRCSLNNKQYYTEDYKFENKEHTLFCSPMYEACKEDDTSSILLGVFFILSNKLVEQPSDLDVQMKILNRTIANLIYRYNACINNKQNSNCNL